MTTPFSQELLVAGGGIGGLAAALAGVRAGWRVRVLEAAPALQEAGAGLQLGPNATRLLHAWGLGDALAQVAAFPPRLVVRSAESSRVLAVLPLGEAMQHRYGAPYATVHRADLQALLLAATRAEPEIVLHLASTVQAVRETGHAPVECYRFDSGRPSDDAGCAAIEPPIATRVPPPPPVVRVQVAQAADAAGIASGSREIEGDALIGADGLWSQVRAAAWPGDPPPRDTGHGAWRALLQQSDLPPALRSADVTVWLGAGLHAVQYPVRGGSALNLVLLVEEPAAGGAAGGAAARGWDHAAPPEGPRAALAGLCPPLADLCEAVSAWRYWRLWARAPVTGAEALARGRVALLGDAAHPMLPYLAQGAGMAIEDAAALGGALAIDAVDVPTRLRRYALARWQRVAQVQARAARNATIFHASGPLRWGRDAGLGLLGARLLDMPWLYGWR